MGRPIRVEYPGALYHITSRGNERKKIFLKDGDRIRFLKILEDYHDRYGILIHCYVLMDNHYHLILETPRGNLLKVMHGINSSYTGYFNRQYGRSGHLFQDRYKGILIEKDSYPVSQASWRASGEKCANFLKPKDRDLKADLSDIDKLDLTLSFERLNLLRES